MQIDVLVKVHRPLPNFHRVEEVCRTTHPPLSLVPSFSAPFHALLHSPSIWHADPASATRCTPSPHVASSLRWCTCKLICNLPLSKHLLATWLIPVSKDRVTLLPPRFSRWVFSWMHLLLARNWSSTPVLFGILHFLSFALKEPVLPLVSTLAWSRDGESYLRLSSAASQLDAAWFSALRPLFLASFLSFLCHWLPFLQHPLSALGASDQLVWQTSCSNRWVVVSLPAMPAKIATKALMRKRMDPIRGSDLHLLPRCQLWNSTEPSSQFTSIAALSLPPCCSLIIRVPNRNHLVLYILCWPKQLLLIFRFLLELKWRPRWKRWFQEIFHSLAGFQSSTIRKHSSPVKSLLCHSPGLLVTNVAKLISSLGYRNTCRGFGWSWAAEKVVHFVMDWKILLLVGRREGQRQNTFVPNHPMPMMVIRSRCPWHMLDQSDQLRVGSERDLGHVWALRTAVK